MRLGLRQELSGPRTRQVIEMPVLRRDAGLHKERDCQGRGDGNGPSRAVPRRAADGDEQDKALRKGRGIRKDAPL